MDIQEKIRSQITENPVVVYMKGTPQFPRCGFSGATVQILKTNGLKDFLAVDVLTDPEIREAIKVYSNWPTIPQLYIKGEFVGGADIVRDLHEQGELKKLLESAVE
ncbi:MAG: Grx4 family monothiol glutaredoxin [Methylophaga sp.]|nr:Grx4 family monothiol glutaredoxin [Methylophaga sp.]